MCEPNKVRNAFFRRSRNEKERKKLARKLEKKKTGKLLSFQ